MEHVHAELIKAWADGAKIQYLSAMGVWTDTEPPSWKPDVEFRVKPVEKSDRLALFIVLENDAVSVKVLGDSDVDKVIGTLYLAITALKDTNEH